ncbi:MAG TPA: hypothetical protein DCY07_06420 [Rhodospirillaceae bacterium]|nr:hypothetical protein [Rhodospirillaceae bacterium]
MKTTEYRGCLVVTVALVVALLAYGVLTMKDNQKASERVGGAVNELSQDVDKAVKEMKESAPVQKMDEVIKETGDKIEETTDKIKENVAPEPPAPEPPAP